MELQEYILLRYRPHKKRVKKEDQYIDFFSAAPRYCITPAKECCAVDGEVLKQLNKAKSPLPKVEKTFMEQVFAIIDEKGLDDVETYKKANIDRRLFSKMRSDMQYRPSRDTAFKFCFALELDLARAKQLLSSAGFAISRSSLRDIVFEYCLTEKIYDLMKVNDKLYEVNVEPELQ